MQGPRKRHIVAGALGIVVALGVIGTILVVGAASERGRADATGFDAVVRRSRLAFLVCLAFLACLACLFRLAGGLAHLGRPVDATSSRRSSVDRTPRSERRLRRGTARFAARAGPGEAGRRRASTGHANDVEGSELRPSVHRRRGWDASLQTRVRALERWYHRLVVRRSRWPLAASVIAVAVSASVANAAPSSSKPVSTDVDACANAAEESQALRKDGQLLESREQLVVCARSTCPAFIQKDCATWLTEVEQALPSIVIRVVRREREGRHPGKGAGRRQAAHRKTRRSSPRVNPGEHVFTYEAAGFPLVTETVLIRQSEANRLLSVTLADGEAARPSTKEEAKPSEGSSSVPVASWVLGGAGVALATLGAALGSRARATTRRWKRDAPERGAACKTTWIPRRVSWSWVTSRSVPASSRSARPSFSRSS